MDKKAAENNWIQLIFGLLAIFAIKSIFEHDNSKIVSKKGSKILSDEDKMREIHDKIEELESEENQQEIFI